MATVHYAQSHQFVANPPTVHGHTVPRPWLEVGFQFSGQTVRVWCLVDTGADDTIVRGGVAALLNLNYHALPQVPLATANGITNLHRQAGMTLDIAGTLVTADVLFGPVTIPLLGRSALLKAVGAGFEQARWHHT